LDVLLLPLLLPRVGPLAGSGGVRKHCTSVVSVCHAEPILGAPGTPHKSVMHRAARRHQNCRHPSVRVWLFDADGHLSAENVYAGDAAEGAASSFEICS